MTPIRVTRLLLREAKLSVLSIPSVCPRRDGASRHVDANRRDGAQDALQLCPVNGILGVVPSFSRRVQDSGRAEHRLVPEQRQVLDKTRGRGSPILELALPSF